MNFIGLCLFTSGLAVIAVGFMAFVRDKFMRDVAPPDLHTEWDRNPWLRDKDALVRK